LRFEICKLHTRPQNKFQEGGANSRSLPNLVDSLQTSANI